MCLHTQQPRVHLMPLKQRTSSLLSGTPKKFDLGLSMESGAKRLAEFDLRLSMESVAKFWRGPQLGLFRDCPSRPISGHLDAAIVFVRSVFFFRGCASKKGEANSHALCIPYRTMQGWQGIQQCKTRRAHACF